MVYKRIKQEHSDIHKQVNGHRMERHKQMNLRSTIIFLIRCRKNGIMPNFIKNSTKNVRKIFNTTEETTDNFEKALDKHIGNFHNKILNLLIRQKHDLREIHSKRTTALETYIRTKLPEDQATQLFVSEENLFKKKGEEIKERHKSKFNELKRQQRWELDIKLNEHWFVNKTNIEIPLDVKWLLSHGEKFAVPLEREEFPLLKYIADGEECVRTSVANCSEAKSATDELLKTTTYLY